MVSSNDILILTQPSIGNPRFEDHQSSNSEIVLWSRGLALGKGQLTSKRLPDAEIIRS